jgi:uncharacterized protein
MTKPTPRFRELTTAECHALLDAHHVGRMAFTYKDRVDIEPIHYVHDDGWLYGRTTAGTKLEIVTHNRWVAFEVDEVRDMFEWQSVVVKGGLYLLRREGSEQEMATYDHGLKVIRRVMPAALTSADPTPERALLFRIHIDEMTGRGAA